MIRQVEVIHAAFEDAPRTVALVQVPAEMTDTQALEFAFKKTNNIMGSWSQGKTFEVGDKTFINEDWCGSVKVMAELPVSKRTGQTMGLRSTSMGDQMLIGNKKYKVDMVGFKEIV